MLNWFLPLVFHEFNCGFIHMVRPAVQETKLVSGVSKVSYILGYNYKNLRLKVSYNLFLKVEDKSLT